MRIVLATRNPGKVAELRALLADLPIELVSADDVEGAPLVEEDAPTLEGNARKKALALHEATGLPALADDTGLEVDALNGRPGVHSARYGGDAQDAAANRARLLREMQTVPHRAARFRTVLAFAVGESVRLFEGVCEGAITMQERGSLGFGYDSIFEPEGMGVTFAEMPADQKNAVSHRRRALDHFAAYLRMHIG
jgi:XTP/dITP diphosphohydrolase